MTGRERERERREEREIMPSLEWIFGFLAFNGVSQAQIAHEGDADVVALAIVIQFLVLPLEE
jgi:hypothetical protein